MKINIKMTRIDECNGYFLKLSFLFDFLKLSNLAWGVILPWECLYRLVQDEQSRFIIAMQELHIYHIVHFLIQFL